MKRFWRNAGLGVFVFFGLLHIAAAEERFKILPGHVPAIVANLPTVGNLDSASNLNLAIGLSLRNTNTLQILLRRLYNPADSLYRKFLTPEQFSERFGPTSNDYSAVVSFAKEHHLSVISTHPNRVVLDVSGSVSNINEAFRIKIRTYRHPKEARDFYAPDTEPTVDASLPIADISGLENYIFPKPKFLIDERVTPVPRSGSGSGGAYRGGDFRAAYLPGVSLTGSGQKVGLLEFDGFYASDITAYESQAGLSAVPVQTVLLDGYSGTPTTGSKSGNPEVSLDIEMAISMAPGLSSVISFEAGPNGRQNDVLNSMVASNQIKQFSSSWGWGGGPSTTTDNIFIEMAAQGQSFFNASGDSDAFTSGASSVNGVDNPSLGNAPSSSPYITEVGGTTLTTTGPGGAWVSETVWNWGLYEGSYVGSSGGISSFYAFPPWQMAVNMNSNGGSTTHRNVPDVALTADNVYVTYGNGTSGTLGGTSCAAPLWAALTALVNEQSVSKGNATVGFINPAIYAIGEGGAYSNSFHDITNGDNTSSSSPQEFYAVPGYDLCTGWGTPAGQPLIDALAGSPNSLEISPITGFTAAGPAGGPFSATSATFVLSNASPSNLVWSVLGSSNWLTIAPSNGTLASFATTQVVVALSASAATLSAGIYSSEITFSNWNSTVAQSVLFTLNIGQSVIQNGGFETGDFTGWTLVGDTVRRTTIYDAVVNISSGYGVVHSGTYGALLGDTKLATLTQTVATVPGQNYLLSIWLDNLDSGSGQQFIANWNSSALLDLTSPPALSWTNYQFIVTASAASSVLQFGAENNTSYFGLDDISLVPIPTVAFQTTALAAGGASLSWNTVSGAIYQVQYTTDLTQPWTNLGPPIVGTGAPVSISTMNLTPSASQYFFRLVLSP